MKHLITGSLSHRRFLRNALMFLSFDVKGLLQSVAENDPRNATKVLEEKFVFLV
jgi:hypothetical protein